MKYPPTPPPFLASPEMPAGFFSFLSCFQMLLSVFTCRVRIRTPATTCAASTFIPSECFFCFLFAAARPGRNTFMPEAETGPLVGSERLGGLACACFWLLSCSLSSDPRVACIFELRIKTCSCCGFAMFSIAPYVLLPALLALSPPSIVGRIDDSIVKPHRGEYSYFRPGEVCRARRASLVYLSTPCKQ